MKKTVLFALTLILVSATAQARLRCKAYCVDIITDSLNCENEIYRSVTLYKWINTKANKNEAAAYFKDHCQSRYARILNSYRFIPTGFGNKCVTNQEPTTLHNMVCIDEADIPLK